ncbi:phage tail terminator protein [Anaerorhabdus sp.]|uniref:phage tail terminator protein n=1 Tax=Anaerorhabdus sp. TaxID=1872524 RepID=UPI002FC91C67
MITLEDVLNYLKTIILNEKWFTASYDINIPQLICLYNKQASGQVNAIGGADNSSYNKKSFTVLIHWDKSFVLAEKRANDIYQLLRKARGTVINYRIIHVELDRNEPIYVGKDKIGNHEFIINAVLWYSKEGN